MTVKDNECGRGCEVTVSQKMRRSPEKVFSSREICMQALTKLLYASVFISHKIKRSFILYVAAGRERLERKKWPLNECWETKFSET